MEYPTNTTAVSLVEADSNPMGVKLVNTVATNKFSKPTDLVALAQQVQKADEFTRATAGSKLTIIAEQIRFLQEQARRVLEEAKRDHDFHHMACNFVKKPGQIYYLYERQSGQKYFSLLSPQEWGNGPPHEFLGAYRLEFDQTWTPIEQVEKRSQEIAFVDKILNAKMAIAESPQFQFTAAKTESRASLREVDDEKLQTS